jgi:hypothetical protein
LRQTGTFSSPFSPTAAALERDCSDWHWLVIPVSR